jgi:DUF4097 and DUF4098 domain-containing protein YvlB
MRDHDEAGSLPLPFGEHAEIDFKSDIGSVMVLPVRSGETPTVAALGRDVGQVGLEVRKEGNVVFVRVDQRDSFFPWGQHTGPVVLRVPAALSGSIRTSAGNIQAGDLGPVDLAISSSAGRVEVRSVHGRLRLRSDAGRIEASELGPGEFEIRSSAGRISVRGGKGRFQLSTSAGRIDGERLAGSIDAQSDMGTVRLGITALDAGEHRVRTQLGSVRVELARGLHARVEGRASLGSVRIQYPSYADAAAVLHCTTEAGSVRVQEGDWTAEAPSATQPSASPAAVFPAEPSEPEEQPGPSETATSDQAQGESRSEHSAAATETERILAMVARGELSPSEADELLRALEQE